MSDKTDAFLKDLRELIDRHNVTIRADDEYQGFPECGQDIQIIADFKDYREPEIKFGTYIDVENIELINV